MTTFLRALALAAAACATPAAAAAQGAPADTVSGRVVEADSSAVAGAEVAVRSARTLVLRRTVTGADGRWRVVFPDTSAAYEVSVSRVGKVTTRLQAVRAGSGAVRAPLAILRDVAVTLTGLVATGERPRVPTGAVGGDLPLPVERAAAQTFDRFGQTRFDRSSLDEVAALAAGATVLADGSVSVGGLDPGQNAVRLNGMSFGGSALPTLARGPAVATTQTADAARGFGGVEVAVQSPRGFYQSPALTVRLRSLEPRLHLAGAEADRLGLRPRERELALLYESAFLDQRASVALALDLRRTARPLLSALGAGPADLALAGIAPDSVARLQETAARLGIPASLASIPGERTLDRVNALARLSSDVLPGGFLGSVHLQADRDEEGPLGVGIGVLPAAGRRQAATGWNAGAELRRSGRGGLLHSGSLAYDLRSSRGEPYLALPGARVRVASELDGGEVSVSSLRLGGGGAGGATRASFWEALYRVDWKSYDERHQPSAGVELRTDHFREDGAADLLGTFVFHSLADFGAGRPASYSRVLDGATRQGRLTRGALFLQDRFTPSERVEIQGGLRAELSAPGPGGELPPEAEGRFGGVRTGLPGEFRLLPRAAVTWLPAPGLQGPTAPPYGTLSAGVSAMRSPLDPAEALLPGGGSERFLRCVGDAAPTPAWAEYERDPGALPGRCLSGDTGPAPSPGLPSPTLYDARFGAPRNWKAHLRWSGRTPLPALTGEALRLTVEGQLLRGVGTGTLDLNFAAVPRFRLGDEDGRAVFVPADAVVPATGTVPLEASRRHPELGAVTRLGLERAVETRSLTVGVTPERMRLRRPFYTLSYTFSSGSARERGFAPDDPTRLEWGPNPYLATHVLNGSLSVPLWKGGEGWTAGFHLRGRLQSGTRFTPRTSGDVNGDGTWGDPAFVFDPATSPDRGVAEGMRRLLEGGSSAARACLGAQLGRVAARGSCTRPWHGSMDAELRAGTIPPVGRGYDLSLVLWNLPGGLDYLLHGASGLRGWGAPPAVDDELLSVRGFDPAGQRFLYDVNPRFGAAPAGRALFRTPFRAELRVTVKLGKSADRVYASDLLFRLRSEAATAADTAQVLRDEFGRAHRLREYASDRWRTRLLLTDDQQRALEAMADSLDAGLQALADENTASLAGVVAARDLGRIGRALDSIRDDAHHLSTAYLRCVRDRLAPDQWRYLGSVAEEVDATRERPEERALWCRRPPDPATHP